MKKRILLDHAPTPDGGSMRLFERDGDYFVSVNGKELMSTREHASEETLATLACRPLSKTKAAQVLIGGLGLGFTLRAALAVLPADAAVMVAELVPAIVRWNRDPRFALATAALADARVTILEQDVTTVLRAHPNRFDAILLDVDNGPTGLTVAGNTRLYNTRGLQIAKSALRPHGCLGIWSATEHAGFDRRIESIGLRVQVEKTPAHPGSGKRHVLYFGWKNENNPQE